MLYFVFFHGLLFILAEGLRWCGGLEALEAYSPDKICCNKKVHERVDVNKRKRDCCSSKLYYINDYACVDGKLHRVNPCDPLPPDRTGTRTKELTFGLRWCGGLEALEAYGPDKICCNKKVHERVDVDKRRRDCCSSKLYYIDDYACVDGKLHRVNPRDPLPPDRTRTRTKELTFDNGHLSNFKRETTDTVNNTGASCCDDTKDAMDLDDWLTLRRSVIYSDLYWMSALEIEVDHMTFVDDDTITVCCRSVTNTVCWSSVTLRRSVIYSDLYWSSALVIKVICYEDDSQDAMDNEDFFILYRVRHNCNDSQDAMDNEDFFIHRMPFRSHYRSSSVPDDTKDRNSCGWFNFPIVSTLKLKTLTDGMRHNRLKIWTRHSRVKRETKDTVNNTGASCSNLYEYLCRELFAICGITMAIPLLTAIAMLTIAILVSTELQSISGWCKTRDMGNCQELITIWRKVKEFIKIIKPYPFIEWEICRPRCGNSSSAAEKQVVQALSTACIRQTFKRASKRHLGLKFLGAYSGSIIIRFVTEMGKSFQKVKDACVSGKIKEFLPNIFMGTGVESKLGEGDVMWKYYVYKEPLRSSGRNVDTARAAVTEIQEEILNPIKLHWNLFVEELDPRKLYADLKSEGLLGDEDGNEMLKIVSRPDKMIFLLERLDALKEPGLGYEILLDHCREHDEYVLQKIMEKEQLQASSKPQEQSTSTGWMSDQKLMFSATIILSVHRKVYPVGVKNTIPECDKEFEITCLDVLDPVCYFENMGEDMEGDDDLQEIFMKLEQVREPEEEKIAIKTKQLCCPKRKRNMQIDA